MALRTMLLILLVGFNSVSTAQDSDESDSSVDYEELAKYLDLLGPSCLRLTGSNNTYEQLVINSVYVPLYLSSKLDVADFQRDLKTLDESNREKFFPKYCHQLHKSLSVLEPVTTGLRKSLDPEEVELLDILIDKLPEAINLACKDNGQIFFMDDSSKCLDKFAGYVKKCAAKVSKTTEAVDLSNYGPKQCNELAEVRECFEQKTAGCKGPRLTDIFDLFYRPILKATPCKSH
uniref:(northern house mosquito) hypothetical protein n=1 Tax=Culex pipiens TaxID=7175 RepID=A0A8D8H852_CULPI